MNMRRTPGIVMISPGVGTWLHGLKFVAAFCVRHYAPAAIKIWIQRRVRLVNSVPVASAGGGLPNFHQSIGPWARVFIEDAAADDNARSDRLAAIGHGQVVFALFDGIMPKNWSRNF